MVAVAGGSACPAGSYALSESITGDITPATVDACGVMRDEKVGFMLVHDEE